jgi:hypothetical protein
VFDNKNALLQQLPLCKALSASTGIGLRDRDGYRAMQRVHQFQELEMAEAWIEKALANGY